MLRKEFSEEEEREIERQYREEKVSTYILAKRWDCYSSIICKFVKKYGRMRSQKEAMKGNQNAVGCKRSKEEKKSIGDKNRNNPACAWSRNKHLSLGHRQNISNSRKMFTKEQEEEICKQYFDKKIGVSTLAKRWYCSTTAIIGAIKRNGFSLRDYREPHTEDAKQKMRKSALRHFQTHHGPFKDTKPELKMKEILTSLNIPFEHQFRLGNHLFDFYILNTNILIEVDGDYWHANPKKYSELNKTQQGIKQKDLKGP